MVKTSKPQRFLDIYYEGRNADYVADADEFNKHYAGLIAVANWAREEARQYIAEDLEWNR